MFIQLHPDTTVWLQPGGARLEIYSNGKGYVSRINKVGAEIIEQAMSKKSVEEIAKHLAKSYNDSEERVLNLVYKFLQKSKSLGHVDIIYHDPDLSSIVVNGSTKHWSPMYAEIELTKKCQLKCIHCYADAGNESAKDLSFSEWKAIFSKLKKAGVFEVSLSGGDPLKHPDATQIIEFCCETFSHVQLLTNGWDVNENLIGTLKKHSKKIIVQVSLDGSKKEFHEYIRRREGSFDRAKDAIRNLSQAGINVMVSMCITPETAHDIENMVKLSIELGAKALRIGDIMPLGRAKNLENVVLSKSNRQELAKNIRALNEKYRGRMLIQEWENEEKSDLLLRDTQINCGTGITKFCVDPGGDVYPCSIFEHEKTFCMGNLCKLNVEDLSRSGAYRACDFAYSPREQICGDCENLHVCKDCAAKAVQMSKMVKKCKWFDEEFSKYIGGR
jgi:radical SAM protein with 4Fe4S-binding SPASM domain